MHYHKVEDEASQRYHMNVLLTTTIAERNSPAPYFQFQARNKHVYRCTFGGKGAGEYRLALVVQAYCFSCLDLNALLTLEEGYFFPLDSRIIERHSHIVS